MTSNKVSSEHIFHDASGRNLSLIEVVDGIRAYIGRDPSASYEVVIGSDSQAGLAGTASFVTAVVVRRIGNGGVHFWTRHQERFFDLRDRIWKETMQSITLAQELRSLIKDVFGEEVLWEERFKFRCIHLDVGEDGPTKGLLDGVCGIVKGFGFEPIIKPYSYGAFVVADKHT